MTRDPLTNFTVARLVVWHLLGCQTWHDTAEFMGGADTLRTVLAMPGPFLAPYVHTGPVPPNGPPVVAGVVVVRHDGGW